MTPYIIDLLCDPISKERLELLDAEYDEHGNVLSGFLQNPQGERYPIANGIPRFLGFVPSKSVMSFGDEWNYFNFTEYKINWLTHTVKNTFGSTDAFIDKVIVDAGGGSGAQTKWFSEYGAKHVVLMELSHSVDDVVRRNLIGLTNVDVIQCSIDMPPLRDGCIEGIVYCHNVIQHTPSVEKTARALYSLVSKGGEFVFNCYYLDDNNIFRWVRHHLIYRPLRMILSKMPMRVLLIYARVMACVRLVPFIGRLSERIGLCIQGDVPRVEGESRIRNLNRRFQNTCLNTFDHFGSHTYQHHKTDDEIRTLVNSLQPDDSKILNKDSYFSRRYIGCALRLKK